MSRDCDFIQFAIFLCHKNISKSLDSFYNLFILCRGYYLNNQLAIILNLVNVWPNCRIPCCSTIHDYFLLFVESSQKYTQLDLSWLDRTIRILSPPCLLRHTCSSLLQYCSICILHWNSALCKVVYLPIQSASKISYSSSYSIC